MRILLIFCTILLLSACSGTEKNVHKPALSYTTHDYIVCKVRSIEVVDMTSSKNASSAPKCSPKPQLISFINNKFRAIGGTIGGVGNLTIIIDNAFLKEIKDEPEIKNEKNYYAVYDVRLKLDTTDNKASGINSLYWVEPKMAEKFNPNSASKGYIELAIHVENFRRIVGVLSKAEEELILEEQNKELIHLLEKELKKQIPVYMKDYLTVAS